jgi:hypothetical protein
MNKIALILVTFNDALRIQKALENMMKRERYFPYPKMPPGYIRNNQEVREYYLLVDAGKAIPLSVLYPEDRHNAFSRSLSLSISLPHAAVIGVLDDGIDPPRFKAFQDGNLLFKYGEDPDYELSHHPSAPNTYALERFTEAIGITHPAKVKAFEPLLQQASAGRREDIQKLCQLLELPEALRTRFSDLQKLKDLGSLFPKLSYALWLRYDSPLL